MIKKLEQFHRLIHINFVLLRHGLDKIVASIPIFSPLRFIAFLNPWNHVLKDSRSRGERIRNALVELGPIFVKFGQALSTRADLLPEDIICELEKLQDQVPPFSGEQAKQYLEQIYNGPLEEIFLEFNLSPLASASVAQVHEVKLLNGEKAVVKILRPNIKKIIRRDINLLITLAKLAERYWSDGSRLRPVEVVTEFERTIFNELDLIREAANASQLKRNFENSNLLYIPEIYWPYAKEQAIVMEYVSGIPISNVETLKQAHVDLELLSKKGVEIFFTQVFRDCFFHADMHPGNIFVNITKPNDPQYIAVDFGIIGTLNADDQRYLASNFLAFFQGNYRQVAKLYVESGWVDPNTRLDILESAIRTICEPYYGRPLHEISLSTMLLKLFQMGKDFDMEIQPQLFLLQKTLLHVEGLGRKLYPELNLWETAKPFLEDWMSKQVGSKALLKNFAEYLPIWLEKAPELPQLLHQHLKNTHNHKEKVMTKKTWNHNDGISKKHYWWTICLGIIIGYLTTTLFFHY